MTEFGSLLFKLMEQRGLTLASLAVALKKRGYEEADEDILMQYIQGEREVDIALPRLLAETLALDFDERVALAVAFTFGEGFIGKERRCA